jgi:hypothetical protein
MTPTDCKTAACNNGVCSQAYGNVADGNGCGDGVCNQCSAGVCAPSPANQPGPGCMTGPSADGCSNADTCDGAGNCSPNDKANGTACTDTTPTDCKTAACNNGVCSQTFGNVADGNACGDGVCNQCANGSCVPTPNMQVGPGCAADTNPCTDDYCNGSGACVHPAAVGRACNDNNSCTKDDSCTAQATCVGTAYSCPAPTQCQASVSCDGAGGCTVTNKPNDTNCNADSTLCTPRDRCVNGTCIPDPNPVTCVQRDCNSVQCNPSTGNCDYTALSGGACGVTGCFATGTCSNGQCSGTPKDCSALDGPCKVGVCDATDGSCKANNKTNGTACTSTDKCLIDTVCVAGSCQGTPKDCSALDGPCTVGKCDAADGTCKAEKKPVGTSCAITNQCEENGQCDDAGKCVGVIVRNGTPCNDNGCTGGGSCMNGKCDCTVADLAVPETDDMGPGNGGQPDMSSGASPGGCSATGGSDGVGVAFLILLAASLLLAFGRRRVR